MFRQTYESMNERLVPDARLVHVTLRKMEQKRVRHPRPIQSPRRRLMAVGLAAVLLVCLSLTAVAAAPQLGAFWESLTARYGQRVQRVGPTASSRKPAPYDAPEPLQVAAVAADRDNADIYFSLAGLEGRMDENILAIGELRVGDKTVPVSASPVFLDEESGAAVFCQSINVPDGMDGSEASLSITSVYSRPKENDDGSPPFKKTFSLALNELTLTENPPTLSYTMPAYMDTIAQSWEARYNTISQAGTVTLLVPGEDQPIPGAEGVSLSAAGYVDGKLHVQFHVKDAAHAALLSYGMSCSDPSFEPGISYDDAAFDAHFNLSNGQVTDFYEPFLNQAGSVFDEQMGYEYVEIISKLPEDALEFWQWSFGLVQSEPIMEGSWSQSFTLSVAGLSMRQNAEPFTVDVETLHLPENPEEEDFASTWAPSTFDGLRVTPFGVTVSRPATAEDETPRNDGILKRFAPDVSKLEITLETADGTQTCTLDEHGYTIVPDGQGRMSARYLLENPVEPEAITSLKVNGVDVPLK